MFNAQTIFNFPTPFPINYYFYAVLQLLFAQAYWTWHAINKKRKINTQNCEDSFTSGTVIPSFATFDRVPLSPFLCYSESAEEEQALHYIRGLHPADRSLSALSSGVVPVCLVSSFTLLCGRLRVYRFQLVSCWLPLSVLFSWINSNLLFYVLKKNPQTSGSFRFFCASY